MRVKISLPERKEDFSCHYGVTIGDLNYGNHMGNDRFLSMAHEARLQLFDKLETSELNFYGTGLIMADSMVQYKAQAFRGDNLTVKIWVENTSSRYFDLIYGVLNQNGKEVARIKTGMIFYDYDNQKISSAPEEFVQLYVRQ